MKRLILLLSILFTSLFLIPSIYNITQSQSIDIEKEAVVYQLPYPGLLADHPLYFIKNIRDKILIFTTRDNGKKATIYLQISDKRIAGAFALIEKGKEQLAHDELARAEDEFLRIPPLLTSIKKQGSSYPADLIMKLYQSNKKHREVITEVMKKSTDTEITTLETLLHKNDEVRKQLDAF